MLVLIERELQTVILLAKYAGEVHFQSRYWLTAGVRE
jgi:hypothetical protein